MTAKAAEGADDKELMVAAVSADAAVCAAADSSCCCCCCSCSSGIDAMRVLMTASDCWQQCRMIAAKRVECDCSNGVSGGSGGGLQRRRKEGSEAEGMTMAAATLYSLSLSAE